MKVVAPGLYFSDKRYLGTTKQNKTLNLSLPDSFNKYSLLLIGAKLSFRDIGK